MPDDGYDVGVFRRQVAVRSIFVALPLMLVASVRGAPQPPDAAPADQSKALQAEATKLFRQKRYAAACEKFQAAVTTAPTDAALLTDLALCQKKLGRDAEAKASNLRAIALASGDAKLIGDAAAARQRRHAYFNLDQLGVDLTLGLSHVGGCAALDAPPGCSRQFHACAETENRDTRTQEAKRTSVKLALSPAGAAWTEDARLAQESEDQVLAQLTEPSPAIPEDVDGWLTVITAFEQDAPRHPCEYDEWACEKSDAVKDAARICIAAAGSARDSGEPIEQTPCFHKLCHELDGKPSKAVLREKLRAAKNVRRCEASAGNEGSSYECSIVSANACTGLVGIVCSSDRVEIRGKTAVRVDEYHFLPGK